MEMLKRVEKGESAEVVYMEEYANADITDVPGEEEE
jgi:hypothetical protein